MKQPSSCVASLLLLLCFNVHAQDPGNPNVDLETCVPVGKDSQFEITLVNMGSSNTEARFITALEKAAERWKKVIINDLPDLPAGATRDLFSGTFDRPYNAAVDDVVIGYDLSTSIDGPGGTLGQAGPVFTRSRNGVKVSTISGVMRFDVDDLRRMPDDDFKAIALHEMGHVLGLVSINGACSSACDPNNPRQQGVYECPLAQQIYGEWAPSTLFLENRGGVGTACGHWEEDSFRSQASSEVMTGFFEANLFQPISRVTVAALQEIGGYEVDYCGADIWPADENTVQRYEVFITQNSMNLTNMMDEGPTIIGMDENIEFSAAIGMHQTFAVVVTAMAVVIAML